MDKSLRSAFAAGEALALLIGDAAFDDLVRARRRSRLELASRLRRLPDSSTCAPI